MARRCSHLALLLTLALALCGHTSVAQQMWAPSGIPVCQNGCPGDIPRIVPDGSGGAIIAWRDSRNSGDVFLQRITASGLIAPGWPPGGFPVVVEPHAQELSGLAPDALGGSLVTWADGRGAGGTGADVFAQRVNADGTLPPGWAVNGNPATLAPGTQDIPSIAADGGGGAYVGWEDWRNDPDRDIYAQHLTASGTPVPGWPEDGLGVCIFPYAQGGLVLTLRDDSGGAVFIWGDGRFGGASVFAQRVGPDGTIPPGWAVNGNPIAIHEGIRGAVRDGQGGFYVATSTPGPDPGFDGNLYLRRFTFDGPPAPGWTASGVLVCDAPGDRALTSVESDGAGGLLMTWYDYRNGAGEIFAFRILPDGSRAPGWTANGTLVSDPQSGQTYDPFIANDGLGGAYIVWQGVSADGNYNPSTIQHLTATGQVAAGWPAYGVQVSSSGDQFDTRIASDGGGGAIVSWDERVFGREGVWAQRFAPLGPTPVLLSLVTAAVKQGRVVLDWHATTRVLQATVSRRTEHSDWLALGRVSADQTGDLRYEDVAVSPGERYAYRLGYAEGGTERFTAETWVDVPAAAFALRGTVPSPASAAEVRVAFSLDRPGPASLELLDISGRLIAHDEEPALTAGDHLLRPFAGPIAPGVYWLRLRQGPRSLTTRAVVMR